MPDWKKIVRNRIESLGFAAAQEHAVAEEIAQHLDDRYRELRAQGLSDKQAQRQAAAELDDLQPMRAMVRRASQPLPPGGGKGSNFIEDLFNDLRYAARGIGRNPLFALFVVLTLGIGIGANTTVFTMVNTLLLNPLPVENSSKLAVVSMAESNASKNSPPQAISNPNLRDLQAENQAFSSLAGYSPARPITLQAGAEPERLFAEIVTGGYFSTLGLYPAAGRFFTEDEDTHPGEHPVAVLNYATWQRRFGAADMLGKTLRVNSVELTIVGIAPPGFIGVSALFGPDLWIPSAMTELLLPNDFRGGLADRRRLMFTGIGRLKPGMTRAQAQANLATVAAALAKKYPEANEGRTAMVRPITDVLFGNSMSTTGPVVFGSVVLMAVVGLVLLIACSNVANLLLARSASRRQEIAVRVAIGASRGRLMRQLLTESMLLALMAGGAGLLIGYVGVDRLWTFLPAGANFIVPKVDASVLAFTLLVSIVTGFAFGTIPALRSSRVDLNDALKEESRSLGGGRQRVTTASVLLGGQVAFSFLLLATAGLFLRSIERAYRIDPGFETDHLLVIMTSPGQAAYTKARTKTFYKDVRARIGALPGVQSVSWASNLPLWGRIVHGFRVEGREQHSKAETLSTVMNIVDLDYFETAGVRVDEGRAFRDSDREDSVPVAIVNEKLARDFWGDQSAIDRRIQLPGETRMRQIVGVVRNANYSTLAEPAQACVYVPLEQSFSDSMVVYVRTRGDAENFLNPVQRELRLAGPEILADFGRTGKRIVSDGLFQARVGVMLLSVFGLLALGLASVGLYGVMAYSVSRRAREIGLRMALGAARGAVMNLVLRQGLSVVAIGVALGLAASLAVGRLLSRMLFGIGSADPISLGGAVAVLALVAAAACYLPARRASRLDPIVALRER